MDKQKTLILVRHAKSSWKDTSLKDIERPLNKRGNRDAVKMGKHMAEHNIIPQMIHSSSGLRALTTARLISVELNIEPNDIVVDDDIYTFSAEQLTKTVRSLNNRYKKVMVVGHNPAITDLVNYFTDAKIDNVPTCGLAVLDFPVNSWKKVDKHGAKLKRFDYPKKLW